MNLLNNFILDLHSIGQSIFNNLPITLVICGILVLIHIINYLLKYKLNYLGIIPRNIIGLRGILFAPFLHGNFEHLLFNIFPLFILLNIQLLYGLNFFIISSTVIYILTSIGLWLFARSGIHIGASAVVMAYWGFVMFIAILYPSVITLIAFAICIYYLGAMFMQILPSSNKQIAWESHLIGAIAGVLSVIIIKSEWFVHLVYKIY